MCEAILFLTGLAGLKFNNFRQAGGGAVIQKERLDIFHEMSLRNRLVKTQFQLTRRCNLRCIHCKVNHNKTTEEISVDDIKKLLPELKKTGCFHLNLTGGEFLMRPDIYEMLEVFFSFDFIYSFQTNATLIDSEVVSFFAANRKKIRTFAISLYAASPEIHDSITGVRGSHERTLDAIKRLMENDLYAAAFCTMMEQNYADAADLLRLCESLGVECRFGTVISPGEGRDYAPLRLRLTEEGLANLSLPLDKLIAMDSHFYPALFAPDKPIAGWCTMGQSSCYIEAGGEVYPCSLVEKSAGNIKRMSFVDIWRNSPVFKEIRDYRVRDFECSRCEHIGDCIPCPGLAYAEQGNMFEAPREGCRIMKFVLRGGVRSEKALHQAATDSVRDD